MGPEESGLQIGEAAAMVLMGWKFRPKENCLGKMEDNCLPKEKGGLEMRDIAKFNCVLLRKWHWNLFHHKGELWARVLDSKYRSWRSLDESRSNTSDSIWWWDLRHVCNASGEEGWFRGSIEWKIGCGAKVKLWEDGWLTGGKSLAEKYPCIYSIS